MDGPQPVTECLESSAEDIWRELRCTVIPCSVPALSKATFFTDLWSPPSLIVGIELGQQACVASAFHSLDRVLGLVAKCLSIFVVFL